MMAMPERRQAFRWLMVYADDAMMLMPPPADYAFAASAASYDGSQSQKKPLIADVAAERCRLSLRRCCWLISPERSSFHFDTPFQLYDVATFCRLIYGEGLQRRRELYSA